MRKYQELSLKQIRDAMRSARFSASPHAVNELIRELCGAMSCTDWGAMREELEKHPTHTPIEQESSISKNDVTECGLDWARGEKAEAMVKPKFEKKEVNLCLCSEEIWK